MTVTTRTRNSAQSYERVSSDTSAPHKPVSNLTIPFTSFASNSLQKWMILLGFSLLSFSSACLWITFAPCIFIFMSHFSHNTTAYINALSTVYMFVYPILLFPSLKIFDTYGLRRGILVGGFLNALGAMLRFTGSFHPSGFWILFIGQTIDAAAQVFILGVPPKLASVWFSMGQQNLAISVGIMANNAGVAAGFLLSPWMIKEKTADTDIPKYLFVQFVACVIIFVFLLISFKSSPKLSVGSGQHGLPLATTADSWLILKSYLFDKPFVQMSMAFGIVIGAQYAFGTLLAQIIVPVFLLNDETKVGLLGFLIVMFGVLASLVAGVVLDLTYAYKMSCRVLYISAVLSFAAFNLALEFEVMSVVFISSILFGVFSFAIPSAAFQYTNIITSSQPHKDEITATGILNSSAQLWGIFLVAIMDATEDTSQKFSMRVPNWLLFIILCFGVRTIWAIDHSDGKMMSAPAPAPTQDECDIVLSDNV